MFFLLKYKWLSKLSFTAFHSVKLHLFVVEENDLTFVDTWTKKNCWFWYNCKTEVVWSEVSGLKSEKSVILGKFLLSGSPSGKLEKISKYVDFSLVLLKCTFFEI